MPGFNYSKLLGRIKEHGFTQKSVASAIGVNESHFCRKLSGEFMFKQSEIEAICNLLRISEAEIGNYFFTPKVEKHQPMSKTQRG